MKIKRYHPGPWECVHDRASKPQSFEWPSQDPMSLWFHKPIPWGGEVVDTLSNVTIARSSRKWIAIKVDEERLWLRKREVRCLRFDHPPKQVEMSIRDVLASTARVRARHNSGKTK